MITTDGAPKKILFLDDHVPYPELGVGYPRARRLILNLCELGHTITFLPLENPNDSESGARRVLPSSVSLALGIEPTALASFLQSHIREFDLILASRPANMRILRSALATLPDDLQRIPILYDAEAIFSIREILQCAVAKQPLTPDEQDRLMNEEMALARTASHVTAVSDHDAGLFRSAGCPSVSVLADGLCVTPASRKFSDGKDLLFVGALDDDSSPNVDAMVWFIENVLPRVRLNLVVNLSIVGRCAAPRMRTLVGPNVTLLGMVNDLEPLYGVARIFIAPHRYAAGIPNKVIEAAAHGVPCVISDLLAGQLGWTDKVEVLTASTAEGFAQAIRTLYENETLWSSLRASALRRIDRQFSVEGFQAQTSAAIDASLRR